VVQAWWPGASAQEMAEQVTDTIERLSALAVDLKDSLGELDINPLFVFPKGRGVKAADALIKPKQR
jgi:acetyltransferase